MVLYLLLFCFLDAQGSAASQKSKAREILKNTIQPQLPFPSGITAIILDYVDGTHIFPQNHYAVMVTSSIIHKSHTEIAIAIIADFPLPVKEQFSQLSQKMHATLSAGGPLVLEDAQDRRFILSLPPAVRRIFAKYPVHPPLDLKLG